MEIENHTIKTLLGETRSENVQLKDLLAALQANVNVSSEDVNVVKTEHQIEIKMYEDRLREMELALVKAESRPVSIAPQIVQESPLPSFQFDPVRGSDGRIESVVATPI